MLRAEGPEGLGVDWNAECGGVQVIRAGCRPTGRPALPSDSGDSW